MRLGVVVVVSLGGGGGGGFVFVFLFCFLNLSSKRLGHAVPDDVVIADIENQALDIFLHGPESALKKKGIFKAFTHSSIAKHPCTFLNKK